MLSPHGNHRKQEFHHKQTRLWQVADSPLGSTFHVGHCSAAARIVLANQLAHTSPYVIVKRDVSETPLTELRATHDERR